MFWLKIRQDYDRIKESPKAETSVKLGVQSLLMSIFGIAATVGFAYLAYLCFTVEGLTGLLTWIFGLISVLAAISFFIELVFASIFYAIYQIKLNRHPLGIVALILSILLNIGTVVAVFLVLKSL